MIQSFHQGHITDHANLQSSMLNIVLASDNQYSEQITTLIKSVCYHHRQVHIYLLHKKGQFSTEWLALMNQFLRPLQSEIIAVHLQCDLVSTWKTLPHINSATAYYRYFIDQLPVDRVLYLDCDTIVNGSLDEFYHTDFHDQLAVVVADPFLTALNFHYEEFPDMKCIPHFNSGVLLINNHQWKALNFSQYLCHLTQRYDQVLWGDQDILNIALRGRFLLADKKYNFQVGARFTLIDHHMWDTLATYDTLDQEPTIIHYTSAWKPWLNVEQSELRFKQHYWFYYALSWQEIYHHWGL